MQIEALFAHLSEMGLIPMLPIFKYYPSDLWISLKPIVKGDHINQPQCTLSTIKISCLLGLHAIC